MTSDEFLNITYYAANASSEDWDVSGGVSWGPDYQDPSTYLDILKQLTVKLQNIFRI